MSENGNNSKTLGIPSHAGRAILPWAAMQVRRLLNTNNCAKVCQARSLDLAPARLLRLEQLGLLAPVSRHRRKTFRACASRTTAQTTGSSADGRGTRASSNALERRQKSGVFHSSKTGYGESAASYHQFKWVRQAAH